MICKYCKKEIEEGIKTCPYCNKETENRCPNCWSKLADGEDICQKCGCNVSEYIMETEKIRSYTPPTLADRVKKLPNWLKIGIPVLVVIIIIALMITAITSTQQKKEELKVVTHEMLVMTDGAIEQISSLAESYESEVYSKDWITYIESAQTLREKSKDKINEIKKTREPVSHRVDIIKSLGSTKAGKLADKVHYCYRECYSYVVGETGKYPNYLTKYNKLVEEYKKAAEELLEFVG